MPKSKKKKAAPAGAEITKKVRRILADFEEHIAGPGKVTDLGKLQALRAQMAKQQLILKITIPAPAVPLLRAFAAIEGVTEQEWANNAILKWMKSDDAMTAFDNIFNAMEF